MAQRTTAIHLMDVAMNRLNDVRTCGLPQHINEQIEEVIAKCAKIVVAIHLDREN